MYNYEGPTHHRNGLAVADGRGRLPLHFSARAFLDGGMPVALMQDLVARYPQGIRVADDNGRLPLHVARSERRMDIQHGDRIQRHCIELLIDYDIFTTLEVCNNGMSPLTLAFELREDRYFPFQNDRLPLETLQLLLEKQKEALRLLQEALDPAIESFNIPPELAEKEVWGFLLPSLWRPTQAEVDGW